MLQDVGEVVGFETKREFGYLLGIELAKNLPLYIFVEILKDFAFGVFVDELPKNAAGLRRLRFEEVRDSRSRQCFYHLPNFIQRPAVDCLMQFERVISLWL